MTLPTKSQLSYAQSLRQKSPDIAPSHETDQIKSQLKLEPHQEGGYFVETDRDPLQVPNPFHGTPIYPNATVKQEDKNAKTDTTSTRSASTTIHYYLDPSSPNGFFHRNKGRTVHTLHYGRAIYISIHADEVSSSSSEQKARVETYIVGHNIAAGEKLQWIVDGGKFKASFLLPDADTKESSRGCLISETVVPGFEYMDHDFLTIDGLRDLVGETEFEELKWLVRGDTKQ